MIAAWKKFWFLPQDPFNLGVLRFFVCCGGAVFYAFMHDAHPEGFYANWQPISFYQLLPGPVSWNVVEGIRIVWLVTAFLAGLGLAFRYTIAVSAIAGVFYNGYTYNFGWVYHSGHVYIMALIVLALSRAGDGFRIFPSKKPLPAASSAYRWPIQLIRCYVVYVFFICGLQKVWQAGMTFDWALSNSFFNMLVSTPYQSPIGIWIQSQPAWVARMIACAGLFVMELGAPLALLGRRWAAVYFFIWPAFHIFVTATFGIHSMFFSQVLVYTAFIDWQSVFGRILPPRAAEARA